MYKLKWYREKWYVSDGKKRHSLRTNDRDVAERRFQDWIAQAQKSGIHVIDICEKYKAHILNKGSADQHFRLKHPIEFFGRLRPDQITRELCLKYIEQRRGENIGDGTINTELGALRAAIRWDDKHTKADFVLPSKPAPKDRYLTRDEFEQLYQGAKLNHVKLFLILALGTGARVTALLELTWDRVDFERGLITLSKGDDPVNKRRATIPMNERVKSELQNAHKCRTCEYVIEHGSQQIKSIKRGVKLAADRAGLVGVSPHVLRHTAAVWMAERKISMAEIAQYLGHSSTRVTERVYARYSPDFLRSASDVLM